MSRRPRLQSPPAETHSRARFWLQLAALLVLAVVVYWPALHGEFLWDDHVFITNNPQMHGPLTDLWVTARPDYLPLTLTLFWTESALWGMNASLFHLVNVLLHALAALALWRLLVRLQLRGAYLAALLFTVHPLCVESVAWIAEAKNMLCLALALASIHLYIDAEERGQTSRYWLALLLYALALSAKSAVIMTPVVLLIVLWWRGGALSRSQMLRTAPFFLLSAIFAVVTVHFQNRVIGAETLPLHGPAARTATAVRAFWFYLEKTVWPHPLTFFYPQWRARLDATTIALALAALALFAALWMLRKRWGRGPIAALAIFLAMLFPVLGFFNMAWMEFAPVADHYAYVALPSLLALAAAAVTRWRERLPFPRNAILASTTANVVLLALSTLTFLQAREYRTEETLWRATIANNPAAWQAFNGLGDVYVQRGDLPRAIENFTRAAELNPQYAAIHNNLGAAFEDSGNLDGAIAQYEKAVAINARQLESQYNLGRLLLRNHRFAEAEIHLTRAAQMLPSSPDVHILLGTALLDQSRSAEAAEQFSRAVQIAPGRADAHLYLAQALRSLGRSEQAFSEYQQGMRLQQRHR